MRYKKLNRASVDIEFMDSDMISLISQQGFSGTVALLSEQNLPEVEHLL